MGPRVQLVDSIQLMPWNVLIKENELSRNPSLLSEFPLWRHFPSSAGHPRSFQSVCARVFFTPLSPPSIRGGWLDFILMVEKITSSVFSSLQCIFHCHAHNRTNPKSQFTSSALIATFCQVWTYGHVWTFEGNTNKYKFAELVQKRTSSPLWLWRSCLEESTGTGRICTFWVSKHQYQLMRCLCSS